MKDFAQGTAAERIAPLEGVTVLDFSRVLSGPFCTMLLADMGARVIKIEHPERGDDTRHWGPPFVGGESAYFLSVNRNKESVALDFKQPAARRVIDALLPRADVLVENFRVGAMARAGLGGDALRERHPRLIYCSISGYGQTGPRAAEAGYDAVTQAESGLMSITGPEGGDPFRLGVAIADIVAGMYAAQGILLALIARHRTGRGQLVDISMLDTAASVLTYQASAYFATGAPNPRLGNRHPSIAPYDTFQTRDGMLILAVGNDDQWQRFCRVAGLAQAAADDRYRTNAGRVRHYTDLQPVLAAAIGARTTGLRRVIGASAPRTARSSERRRRAAVSAMTAAIAAAARTARRTDCQSGGSRNRRFTPECYIPCL